MPQEPAAKASIAVRWTRAYCVVLGIGTTLYILRAVFTEENSDLTDIILSVFLVVWWTVPYLLLTGLAFKSDEFYSSIGSAILLAGIDCFLFGNGDEFSGHGGALGLLFGPVILILVVLPAIVGLVRLMGWGARNIRWR
jgi:hypothetical protein